MTNNKHQITSCQDDNGYTHFNYSGVPAWKRIPHKCTISAMGTLTLFILGVGILGGLFSLLKGCAAFVSIMSGGSGD